MLLTKAQSDATEYNKELGDVQSRIDNANSLEDLGQVVTALVADTRAMVVEGDISRYHHKTGGGMASEEAACVVDCRNALADFLFRWQRFSI